MTKSLRFRAAIVSLVIFAAFIGTWHSPRAAPASWPI